MIESVSYNKQTKRIECGHESVLNLETIVISQLEGDFDRWQPKTHTHTHTYTHRKLNNLCHQHNFFYIGVMK